jgi:hypothetical protein
MYDFEAPMNFDPTKLSDAIKSAITTAGIYKLALMLVFAAYWYCATNGIIPDAEKWEIRVAAGGAFLFGFLWVANVVASIIDFLSPRAWLIYWHRIHKEKQHVRRYIQSMTETEREIIGYLLTKNQKLFIASHDGGYAMPLISQKIVIHALQPGQQFDLENSPMVIPDHVWDVLLEHKEQFPSVWNEGDPHPWRIPWMAR